MAIGGGHSPAPVKPLLEFCVLPFASKAVDCKRFGTSPFATAALSADTEAGPKGGSLPHRTRGPFWEAAHVPRAQHCLQAREDREAPGQVVPRQSRKDPACPTDSWAGRGWGVQEPPCGAAGREAVGG